MIKLIIDEKKSEEISLIGPYDKNEITLIESNFPKEVENTLLREYRKIIKREDYDSRLPYYCCTIHEGIKYSFMLLDNEIASLRNIRL